MVQWLNEPTCRLLTIAGPGGVGKTRLSIEIARTIFSSQASTANHPPSTIHQPPFPDGVYFVSLASVSTPAYMIPTIADALVLRFMGQLDVQTQLFNHLRSKELLLVLDNLEQLLGAEEKEQGSMAANDVSIKWLLSLLQAALGVKLLVPSREPLNLPGEWIFDLHGLRTPTITPGSTLAADGKEAMMEVEADSAIALFLQIARRLKADFCLTPQEQRAVARICQLVDGLPLGIELAASWVRALSCVEIVNEIQRNLVFLTTTQRGMPVRHRSMLAVFDHSWQLLAEEEQRVLAALSLLRGGFTREAAADVTGATLPVLSTLIAKSLVRRSGEQRYDLHELVRQYAASKLAANPTEQAAAQQRHSTYFLTWVNSHRQTIISRRQLVALKAMSVDIDNIRLAWEWAVRQQQWEELGACVWVLFIFFELRSYFQEGEATFRYAAERLQRLLEQAKGERATLEIALANMLTHQGFFLFRIGSANDGLRLQREAVHILRQHNDQAVLMEALMLSGITNWFSGRFSEAANYYRESLALSRTLGRSWHIAWNMTLLAPVLHDLGDYQAAYQLFQEAMAFNRQQDDPRALINGATFMGRTGLVLGHYSEMAALLREARQLAEEMDDRFSYSMAAEPLALANHALGNSAEAWRLLEESCQIYRQIGDHWSLARARNQMGNIALTQNRIEEVQGAFYEALQTAQKVSLPPQVLDALVGLATILAQSNNATLGLALAEVVQPQPAATQEVRDRAGKLSADLCLSLSAEAVASAHAWFQDKALEGVVAEVIGMQSIEL